MIDELNVALLLSVAYAVPYVDTKGVTTLSNEEVFKLVDMYNDEVESYIKLKGVRTVSSKSIKEDAHVLCDGTLIHVGVFEGGYIPSESLLGYRKMCSDTIMLHTHPVPLPIPTLEDLLSMYQIGYRIECILSKIDEAIAKMVCVEPLRELKDVVPVMESFVEKVYSLVDKYIVVEDEFGVQFLPYPSNKNLGKIESEFVSVMKKHCRVSVISFDMNKKEYEINTIF
ncbi:MAG: hypothetical protein QW775_03530, partial [Ignisphaera sp.]|uniref:Uncharacterized protein n=1 Tax=Ignisphaera aggregans TaxID=334771 RepID=A0A7C4JIY8_9CREN